MRWIKHMTRATDDEKIAQLLAECGHEGYGFYWHLLEIVGRIVERGSDKCSLVYPLISWSKILGCHHNKTAKYLAKLAELKLIALEYPAGATQALPSGYPGATRALPSGYPGATQALPSGYPPVTPPSNTEVKVEWKTGSIGVIIRNLLKYRDEYAGRSGHTPERLPSNSRARGRGKGRGKGRVKEEASPPAIFLPETKEGGGPVRKESNAPKTNGQPASLADLLTKGLQDRNYKNGLDPHIILTALEDTPIAEFFKCLDKRIERGVIKTHKLGQQVILEQAEEARDKYHKQIAPKKDPVVDKIRAARSKTKEATWQS